MAESHTYLITNIYLNILMGLCIISFCLPCIRIVAANCKKLLTERERERERNELDDSSETEYTENNIDLEIAERTEQIERPERTENFGINNIKTKKSKKLNEKNTLENKKNDNDYDIDADNDEDDGLPTYSEVFPSNGHRSL